MGKRLYITIIYKIYYYIKAKKKIKGGDIHHPNLYTLLDYKTNYIRKLFAAGSLAADKIIYLRIKKFSGLIERGRYADERAKQYRLFVYDAL